MDNTNVNNLNGVPNFGHGVVADAKVQAGITDVPSETVEEAPVEIETQEAKEPSEEVEITSPEQE